ncbi:MAG TPA: nitroreductase, partial [Thermoanaerobaculia bacterium]|nr:nitroreductase [Thermoanaerobaculia bacterium]
MSPYDPRVHPYLVDEAEFYEIEEPARQKEFLLRYAVLAPSGHNTQPWAFRAAGETVEVFADYSRRLPVADPHDRELMISIGAAIANLRIAAAHFGFDT